jgi:hypothetical protein
MMKPSTFVAITLMSTLVLTGCQSKKKDKQPEAQQIAVQDNTIPDIKMNDISGNPTSVKAEVAKNKITILDFWASWCGPCVQETPSVVALYNDYHAKGLGIIGISLDKDKASWKQAVNKLDMMWMHLSDLQGWDSAVARLFNVNSIPHTVVVNGQGTILAQGLRGDDLRQFIADKLD